MPGSEQVNYDMISALLGELPQLEEELMLAKGTPGEKAAQEKLWAKVKELNGLMP